MNAGLLVQIGPVPDEALRGMPGIQIIGDWFCEYDVIIDNVRVYGGCKPDLQLVKEIHGVLAIGDGCRVDARGLVKVDKILLGAGAAIRLPHGTLENKG